MTTNPQTDIVKSSPDFAAIPERNTGDVILRTMQQHHVQLSVMADNKANILITVSSIVLTMVLANLKDPDLRAAMLTLAGFVLIALLPATRRDLHVVVDI